MHSGGGSKENDDIPIIPQSVQDEPETPSGELSEDAKIAAFLQDCKASSDLIEFTCRDGSFTTQLKCIGSFGAITDIIGGMCMYDINAESDNNDTDSEDSDDADNTESGARPSFVVLCHISIKLLKLAISIMEQIGDSLPEDNEINYDPTKSAADNDIPKSVEDFLKSSSLTDIEKLVGNVENPEINIIGLLGIKGFKQIIRWYITNMCILGKETIMSQGKVDEPYADELLEQYAKACKIVEESKEDIILYDFVDDVKNTTAIEDIK
jgi:hypothetical protein